MDMQKSFAKIVMVYIEVCKGGALRKSAADLLSELLRQEAAVVRKTSVASHPQVLESITVLRALFAGKRQPDSLRKKTMTYARQLPADGDALHSVVRIAAELLLLMESAGGRKKVDRLLASLTSAIIWAVIDMEQEALSPDSAKKDAQMERAQKLLLKYLAKIH